MGPPSAGLGALLTLMVFKVDLNLYAFAGVIMLVGIVKKNGVMMIDFALAAQRNEGQAPADAICEGALVRSQRLVLAEKCGHGTRLHMAEGSVFHEDRVLGEIVRRLVAVYAPERIYLFGSKARGDSGPDSDYDLMVVVADDAPAEMKRSRLAYEALWGTGSAADVLLCTRTYFQSRLHVAASLPATIAREGKLLHAA